MSQLNEIQSGTDIGKCSRGKYIWVACPICGKERWIELRRGKPRWSSLCHSCAARQPLRRAKISLAEKGKHLSEEHKIKLSRALKGRKTRFGYHPSKETKAKISKALMGNKHLLGKYHTEESKLKMSLSRRRLWQDIDYIKKAIQALHCRPTKPERELISLLDRRFPRQFSYNGDFRQGVSLGGLIPDFVNINGKKEVIEIFGDYWHSSEIIGNDWGRSELGKIMVYNSLGWKCLVIWEHELNELTEEQIVQKINTFFKRKKLAGVIWI